MADELPNNNEVPPQEGFFDGSENSRSMMRLMCFISLLAAIVFGFLTISIVREGKDAIVAFYLTGAFIISAFGGKVGQSIFELQSKK
jgi:hypothetical protein